MARACHARRGPGRGSGNLYFPGHFGHPANPPVRRPRAVTAYGGLPRPSPSRTAFQGRRGASNPVKHLFRTGLFIATLLAAAVACGEQPLIATDSRHVLSTAEVRTVRAAAFRWHDPARNRTVPATVYYPEGNDGGLRVVVFSHGLGRSRQACAYLGHHWARHGYVSVHVEHAGSNESARRGTLRPKQQLRQAFYSPANRRNRPLDVRFVLDRLAEHQRHGTPLGRRLDLARVGVAGHDFGAQTALVLAGGVLPEGVSYPDPRVKAVIAMSTPLPEGLPLAVAFGDVRVPCLHVTGTLDDSVVATTRAEQRRLPFDHITGAEQYLVTFFGADHMIYAGHPVAIRNLGRNDAEYQQRLLTVTTLFWDAHLKQAPEALAAIARGALAAAAGRIARVEQKPGERPVASAKVPGVETVGTAGR
jgi:predicted dienelactone hydrolase